MELRQLAFSVAVARHRSFTRAAEELLVAQPALSVQIRKLEEELGTRLFERTTRHVDLTPAGVAFVARAERILTECATATREMAEYSGASRGLVRVGAWYAINPGLPALLLSFLEAHRGIDLTLREETSEVMLDLLRNGELDVALPVLRDHLDMHELEYLMYLTEPFVLATPPDSPLRRHPSIGIDELMDAPLIVLKHGAATRFVVERAFAAAGIKPRVTIETTDSTSARAFVSHGLGVAIIPTSAATSEGPPIGIVDLRDAPVRRSAAVWRRQGRTPSTDAFIAHVRSLYPDRPVVEGT